MQESTLKATMKGTSPSRSQTLYNVGLCLWALSFDDVGMQQLEKNDFVDPLVGLLKQGVPASLVFKLPARPRVLVLLSSGVSLAARPASQQTPK